MTPQYIVLTVTRVAVRNRNNPRQAQATIMQPPIRQLFVLPMMISKAQHGENAEIEHVDGQLLSVAEHFDDIVNAINDAAMGELAVAKPVRRNVVEEAAAQVSPLKRIADEMRDGTANFVKPSEAECPSREDRLIDDMKRTRTAIGDKLMRDRAAEGAKHQGELPGVPSSDITGDKLNSAGVRDFPDEAPSWSDFVQTDGGNVGAPAKRQPVAGDLRIVRFDGDFHWIEAASEVEGGIEWKRTAGIPSELMTAYESYDAARQAVKLAGYIRRLIED